MTVVLTATAFIMLHAPDGHGVLINPDAITSMQPKRRNVKADDKLFPSNANCLVNLADGKYIAVTEECTAVQRLLEAAK